MSRSWSKSSTLCNLLSAKFEVFTVMEIQVKVFCTVTVCTVMVRYDFTWRWRQHGPPKQWYPTTTIHSVTNHKTLTWTMKDLEEIGWKVFQHPLIVQSQLPEIYISLTCWRNQWEAVSRNSSRFNSMSTISCRQLQKLVCRWNSAACTVMGKMCGIWGYCVEIYRCQYARNMCTRYMINLSPGIYCTLIMLSEVDHSLPPTAKVKNALICTCTPHISSWCGA